MPRRAARYNPTALRIWRTLKRMGIVSPQGIFLSFLFWSLFISFTYFTYIEVSKILANIEARKLNSSKLHPSVLLQNEALQTKAAGETPAQMSGSKWDAFGFFKTYWNKNSYVGDFVSYLKDKTQNITVYKIKPRWYK